MHEELQEQEAQEQVQEVVEEPTEQQEAAAAPEKSTTSPQESFRQLREKAERAERERDEMRRILEQTYAQTQKAQEPEEDPNEILERRHLKHYEQELKQMRQEIAYTKQTLAEKQLKSQYADFDKVVNEDTVAEFRARNPKLAASLANTDDLYEKGEAVYQLIRNMGIYKEDNHVAEKLKAQENTLKPKPSNTISPQRGESPLSHANAFANGLTEELKKQLLREMESARRGG